MLLANLMVRRPVHAALDIGTGCGALALLAAPHSDRVVATDMNPRALNLAAFNASLDGIDNVEWRQGSLFEPVEGDAPVDAGVLHRAAHPGRELHRPQGGGEISSST